MLITKYIDFTEEDFKDADLRARFYWGIYKDDLFDCHIWVGTKSYSKYHTYTYGHFYFKGSAVLAHRMAYLLANGPGSIPENYVIMHLCDNPCCVNPDHLRAGTQSENIQDMLNKGRNNPNWKENFRVWPKVYH